MISGKDDPDSSLPPAVDGLLRVHKRIIDGLESDFTHTPSGAAGKVSTKLLVAASQAGSLIGKQGGTVKSIQEASNCIVRVLGAGSYFFLYNIFPCSCYFCVIVFIHYFRIRYFHGFHFGFYYLNMILSHDLQSNYRLSHDFGFKRLLQSNYSFQNILESSLSILN